MDPNSTQVPKMASCLLSIMFALGEFFAWHGEAPTHTHTHNNTRDALKYAYTHTHTHTQFSLCEVVECQLRQWQTLRELNCPNFETTNWRDGSLGHFARYRYRQNTKLINSRMSVKSLTFGSQPIQHLG